MLKDFYASEIVNYFAGSKVEWASDEAVEIMALAQRDWDSVEVSPEGPSKEEDAELDAVLEDTAKKLMDLDCASIYNFRFDYVNKTPEYNEYDGTVINAPNEEFAWQIFLGCDSEYGLPSAKDYNCVKL